MADLPISGLPAITVPSNSYLVAAVSASVTTQMTLAQVAAAMSSSFTASQAISASYATSASYEINYETSSSYADTASIAVSASYALTASYAESASYAPNSNTASFSNTASYAISASYAPDTTFPYSGSALITGSLGITGSLSMSGSIFAGGDIIPLVSKSFSLGSADFPFRDIFISSGSLVIASDDPNSPSTTLSNVDGNILVSAGGMQLVGSGSFNAETGSFQYLSGSYTHVGNQQTTGSVSITGSGTLNGRAIATNITATFDPLFNDLSGSVVGVAATGSYTLIDGLCYFRVYVDFASCTNFGNSQYAITLPFPSIQTISQRNGTIHQVGSGSALYHIAGTTENTESATLMKLYYSGGTTDLAWKYNTPVGATSPTSHFDINGIYQIA